MMDLAVGETDDNEGRDGGDDETGASIKEYAGHNDRKGVGDLGLR